jgi:peptidoglycan hydrolase CwlO-like protein
MKKSLALSLSVLLFLNSASMVQPKVVQAEPVNNTQKSNAENQLKESEKALQEAENKLYELETAIQKLDNQIEALLRELDENKKAINKSENDVQAAKQKVETAEEEIIEQQELFDSRMRAMYKNGSQGYISIILTSQNFTDLVSKVEAVTRMISYDKKVAEDLRIKKDALLQNQRILEVENMKLVALKEEKETKLTKFNSNKNDQQKLINEAKKQSMLLTDKVKKDKEAVNSAIVNMDNDAIKIANSQTASTEDIKSAISYLTIRVKDTKSSQMQNAILKAQTTINNRNKPANTSNGNNNSNSGNNNGQNNSANAPSGKDLGASVARYAYQFLGTPYLWGGTRPYKKGDPDSGFDCSGLVQYCYKQFGISITRTTYTQVKYDGKTVDKENLIPGDLVFFGTWDDVHHVGMYVGNGCYIHAPRTGDVVKIDTLASRKDYLVAKRIVE